MATLAGQMINDINNINNINNMKENNLLNPFNDPPINCTESDIHWIWSKKLEERRGHYVDSKKSRKFYVTCTLDSNDKQITNFSKAFRPGSYGKLQSLKKGSWKEGKIFYVFNNDELTLNINENISIVFDLNSCASNSNNEANTIDGWKAITGGVGFYRPPSSLQIASVLVLRKHPNFPLECLQNSNIKIYSNIPNPSGIIYIGSKIINLNNNNNYNNYNNNNDTVSSVSTLNTSYQSNEE
eukprot:46673_1